MPKQAGRSRPVVERTPPGAKHAAKEPYSPSPGLSERLSAYRRRHRRERVGEIFDGLATLLASGVPLVGAIEALGAARRRGSAESDLLLRLARELGSGQSLSGALLNEPAWFAPTDIAIVRAAEQSGTLPEALAGLARTEERSSALAGKLAEALTYPAVLLVVGLGVWAFLAKRTLPSLAGLLTENDVEVPRLTAQVIALGQRLTFLNLLLTLSTLAAVWGFIRLLQSFLAARGRRLPLSGYRPRVLREVEAARFTGELSNLLSHGVPLAESLSVLGPALGRSPLRALARDAVQRLERGEGLSEALAAGRAFDAEALQMVRLGEATGDLEGQLQRLSQRLERRSHRSIDRCVRLAEPMLILSLAAAIGVLVMAAILPMTRLQELVR